MSKLHERLPSGAADLINRHHAPLRIARQYRLHAAPEQVFSILGDLEGITSFFPMIHHADVRHAGSCAGEGSVRVCSIRGMGKVNERIVWWDEPKGYAYAANGTLVPLRDHLGVIVISDLGNGESAVEWRQYFNTRLGPLGWLFPLMMRRLMDRSIRNIAGLLRTPSAAAVRN